MNRREIESKRNLINALNYSLLLGVQIILLVLYRISGSKSMGFTFIVFGMFFLLNCICGNWQEEFTYRNIRGRIGRGMENTINHFLGGMMVFSIICSIVISLLVLIFINSISSVLLGVENYSILFIAATPCIMLCSIKNSIYGYFRGRGEIALVYITKIIQFVIGSISSIILCKYLRQYGMNVGNLLFNSNMEDAYAALGIVLGYISGATISVMLLIYFFIRKYKTVNSKYQEVSKNKDSLNKYMKNIVVSCIPEILHTFFYKGIYVFFFLLYIVLSGSIDNEILENSGYCFGILLPFAGIILFGYLRISIPHYYGMTHLKQIDDYKQLQEKINGLVKGIVIWALPLCLVAFTMSEPLCEVIIKESNERALDILLCGIFLAVIATFSATLKKCLLMIGHSKSEFIVGLISLIAGIVTASLLYYLTKLSFYAFLIGLYVDLIINCIINVAVLKRKVHSYFYLMEDIIKPLLCASISAFIIFLLGKALKGITIPIVFLIISILIYFITYFIFLLLFRCIRRNELHVLPWGGFLEKIGRILHVF